MNTPAATFSLRRIAEILAHLDTAPHLGKAIRALPEFGGFDVVASVQRAEVLTVFDLTDGTAITGVRGTWTVTRSGVVLVLPGPEPVALTADEVWLVLRQWTAYGPAFDIARITDKFRAVALHVRTTAIVDQFAELLTGARMNVGTLYGDRTYEVMGTHSSLPGWTVFVQRHEPTDAPAVPGVTR